MPSAQNYKKGDVLIEFGIAYEITQIKNQKNLEGEKEPFIFYQPVFENNRNRGMVCSIPLSSLSQTNKRRPLSKYKLDQYQRLISQRPKTKKPVNAKSAQAMFKTNDIHKLARLIARLWVEKQDPRKNFPISKQSLLDQAVKHLSQEIGVVYQISLDKAEQKIRSRLDKLTALIS